MKTPKNYFKTNANEKKALEDYMNNYATPIDIAKRYDIDIDKLRKLIQIELKKEELKDLYNQIGNPFIDLDE